MPREWQNSIDSHVYPINEYVERIWKFLVNRKFLTNKLKGSDVVHVFFE
jgi:hypothetical protein